MPTVLRFDGLLVLIYPNDHRPSHVHVLGPDREALFYLNCPQGPVELRENFRFRKSELNRILEKLSSCVPELCAAWKEIHGNF